MGIEQRGNRRYYYRKVRRGKQVVSEYYGGGDFAQTCAAIDAFDRERRAQARAAWQAEQSDIEQHDQQLRDLGRLVQSLVVATLEAYNCHRHKGQWRKRRNQEMTTTALATGEHDIAAQAERLDTGKATKADRSAFRAVLKQEPDNWRLCGDLAHQAQLHMITTLNAPSSMKESLTVGLSALAVELGARTATPLELGLIEQVVTTWLQLAITQYHYIDKMHGQLTLAQGDYWERRLTTAQHRYLRAIETLARVRRLEVVTLQVNIATNGGQQINVAGGVPALERTYDANETA